MDIVRPLSTGTSPASTYESRQQTPHSIKKAPLKSALESSSPTKIFRIDLEKNTTWEIPALINKNYSNYSSRKRCIFKKWANVKKEFFDTYGVFFKQGLETKKVYNPKTKKFYHVNVETIDVAPAIKRIEIMIRLLELIPQIDAENKEFNQKDTINLADKHWSDILKMIKQAKSLCKYGEKLRRLKAYTYENTPLEKTSLYQHTSEEVKRFTQAINSILNYITTVPLNNDDTTFTGKFRYLAPQMTSYISHIKKNLLEKPRSLSEKATDKRQQQITSCTWYTNHTLSEWHKLKG